MKFLNSYNRTLRRFRFASPEDEGIFVGDDDDDDDEYDPLPFFVNGIWDRRKLRVLVDFEVSFNVFDDDDDDG